MLTREGVRGLEWVKWSEHPTLEHNVTIPFIRMLAGEWTAVIFEDGNNAARRAEDYRRGERQVSKRDTLSIRLAPGGGWTARIVRSD